MLQVLIVHWDFSHHVTWHITRETTGLTVIKPIRIFVSKHLINTVIVLKLYFRFWQKREKVHVHICMSWAGDRVSEKAANQTMSWKCWQEIKKKSLYLCTHSAGLNLAQTGNSIMFFQRSFSTDEVRKYDSCKIYVPVHLKATGQFYLNIIIYYLIYYLIK